MGKIKLDGFVCERCGHKWVKRANSEGEPVVCPKCKSPYWNKPRRKK
jgi:DNA-directed RNA polymerase subunit RPC12/RpoP